MAASHPRRASEAGGSADKVAFEERQLNQCGTGDRDGPLASPILMLGSMPNSGGAWTTVGLPRRTMGGPAEAIAPRGPALTIHSLHVSAGVRLAHTTPRAAGG
jgi:hypothetical protein